jgi:hypothetical protein
MSDHVVVRRAEIGDDDDEEEEEEEDQQPQRRRASGSAADKAGLATPSAPAVRDVELADPMEECDEEEGGQGGMCGTQREPGSTDSKKRPPSQRSATSGPSPRPPKRAASLETWACARCVFVCVCVWWRRRVMCSGSLLRQLHLREPQEEQQVRYVPGRQAEAVRGESSTEIWYPLSRPVCLLTDACRLSADEAAPTDD